MSGSLTTTPPWLDDTPAANDRPIRENFAAWFGRSVATDAIGAPRVLFHGTSHDIEAFDPGKTIDGGFHFGNVEQAHMRCTGSTKKILVPVFLAITNPRRSRDAGGNWAAKIKSAKASGCDGIVYLNRYEGLELATVYQAAHEGIDLDRLTDAQFRRYVPEAEDSFIAFRPEQVKSAIGNTGLYCAIHHRSRTWRRRFASSGRAAPCAISMRGWAPDSAWGRPIHSLGLAGDSAGSSGQRFLQSLPFLNSVGQAAWFG